MYTIKIIHHEEYDGVTSYDYDEEFYVDVKSFEDAREEVESYIDSQILQDLSFDKGFNKEWVDDCNMYLRVVKIDDIDYYYEEEERHWFTLEPISYKES